MAKNVIQITNDNHQFAGNKENKVNGLIHIEDWFDEFINNAGDYWKETYFELLRFESEFYYLKEFIVQARLLAVDEVVKQIKMGTGTQKIIDLIPEWIPNTLSPFELLLTKWIVADYIFTYQLGVQSNTHTFYNTVKIIVERDTKNFPIQIDLQSSFHWTIDINWVNNKWRLVQVKQPKNLVQGNTVSKQTTKQIKPLQLDLEQRQIIYLFQKMIDEKLLNETKNPTLWDLVSQYFTDKDGNPFKNIHQNKDGLKNTKTGKPKKGAEQIEKIVTDTKAQN